mmetsp:Transcript_74153/g.186861  ORF Transcript_74153/g.186861 Transcript_74153/m.186861 type:complete len:285 (+) Transcript_74153:2-856(+)
MKSQDTHTMLIFIKGYLNEVRMKMSEQLTIMKDDLGGTTKQLLSAMHGVMFGDDDEYNQRALLPVHVKVERAKGLRNADWLGTSDPYCVCEVKGKPETKFETQTITDTLEPNWNYEQEVFGFTKADSLIFTLWDKDPGKGDDFLGQAELTGEELLKHKKNFHGNLKIDSESNAGGSLRVKVIDPNKGNSNPWRTGSEKKTASLCGLSEDIEKLSSKLEADFAKALQDMLSKSGLHAAAHHTPNRIAPVIPPRPVDEVSSFPADKKTKARPFSHPSPCCNVSKGN